MTASQSVAIHRRLPGSTAIIIAASFAVGSLLGLAIQGALDRASAASGARGGTPSTGAATNNVNDAANAAVHSPATPVIRFRGVAANNMSDAANAAVHGLRPFQGVANNNMSDAARQAVYATAR